MAELVVCTMSSPASLLICRSSISSCSAQRPRGLWSCEGWQSRSIPREKEEGLGRRAGRGRAGVGFGIFRSIRNPERKRMTCASNQDGVDVEGGPAAQSSKVFVDPKVWVTLIDAELERGNDRQALSLAKNLRAFGKAAMHAVMERYTIADVSLEDEILLVFERTALTQIFKCYRLWCLTILKEKICRDDEVLLTTEKVPQKIYTLEDLRLNKIDASKFLSPVDRTLGSVRRNLQVALIVGGVAMWRAFDLNIMQVLGVVVFFLFIGTVDQVANAGGLEGLILDTLGRLLSRNYKDRVAQHEAGHFLISYLMGILPKSYTLSSLEAFQRYAALNVQAGTTFVDFEFQEEVASGKVSAGTLDKVSCIALAGVATEYLLYGVAEGGLADIQQLDDLMRGLGFTQRKADGQVRWAVLNTVTLLRRHKAVHSKLATAMSFQKTVAECIGVIETELANVAYI